MKTATMIRPISVQSRWRTDDPEPTCVSELSPDDISRRIVIRTKEFLGTVYGTLVGVRPHPVLPHFTCIQLYGKKELTVRDDMEAIVLDF